ncbi:kinase-like domain-containing protein [Pavlovales sp. CCMP2436]|nr:kinase-like domain-containing protein [Pavlovales sp. CCMP2436]
MGNGASKEESRATLGGCVAACPPELRAPSPHSPSAQSRVQSIRGSGRAEPARGGIVGSSHTDSSAPSAAPERFVTAQLSAAAHDKEESIDLHAMEHEIELESLASSLRSTPTESSSPPSEPSSPLSAQRQQVPSPAATPPPVRVQKSSSPGRASVFPLSHSPNRAEAEGGLPDNDWPAASTPLRPRSTSAPFAATSPSAGWTGAALPNGEGARYERNDRGRERERNDMLARDAGVLAVQAMKESSPSAGPAQDLRKVSRSRLPPPTSIPPPSGEGGGRTIRWQRGEMLGAGSFGKVYLGFNLASGEMLAVKQISIGPNTGKNGAETLANLESEISVLQGLRHPNIVQYLGVERDEAEGTLSIFLEYVAGGSIHSIITKFGAFSEALSRRYMRHIVCGVAYLHSHKIIHRDIKGANVLVDQAGVCKLADFGASKRIAEVTLGASADLRSLKGTPFWMAPEVIKQTGHGPEADIWSLGCTMIEMATGRPPWSHFGSQISALFHIASAKTPPPLPDGLTELGRDFLSRMLRRAARERPKAAQLLQHGWLFAPDETMKEGRGPIQQLIRFRFWLT